MAKSGLHALVVYVDVDDTLIRTAGTKRIPVSGMVDHVRRLHSEGATLYCWSSGGAQYAREVATELGIGECFVAFLPKPDVMLDDQKVENWRRLVQIPPGRSSSMSIEKYQEAIRTGSTTSESNL